MIRILCIDDAPEIISLIRSAVMHDYTVLAARDGAKGVEVAITEQPDLILLDVTMPKMDGWETLEVLQENMMTKDIPVIFVTGRNSPDDEARCLKAGAVDFVAKPIDKTVLLARINNQIRLGLANKELARLNKQLEEERQAMLKFISLTRKQNELVDSLELGK